MLGENPIKVPFVSKIVDKPFKKKEDHFTMKNFTLTWEELMSMGTVKEDVISNDDNLTTVIRYFVANDGSMTRQETYTLPTTDYKRYLKETNIVKMKEEIYNLEMQMKEEARAHNFELCSNLREQINFIKDKFKLNKNE